jgi:hypothetical protein
MGHFAGIKRPNFGTVSTGTRKPLDLRESFLYELKQQRPLLSSSREIIRILEEETADIDSVESDVLVLIVELGKYAPAGYYFGASVSDSADFGYWPEDSAQPEQHRTLRALTAHWEIEYLYRELTTA